MGRYAPTCDLTISLIGLQAVSTSGRQLLPKVKKNHFWEEYFDAFDVKKVFFHWAKALKVNSIHF